MSKPQKKSSMIHRFGTLMARTTSGTDKVPHIPGRRDVPVESSSNHGGYDSDMNNSFHGSMESTSSPVKGVHTGKDHQHPLHPKDATELTPKSCLPADEKIQPPLADFSPIYQRWSSMHRFLEPLCCKKEDRMQNPIGLLEVDIIEGFGLPASDLWVTSDPYCIATLTGYWSSGQEWPLSMRSYVKTPIINQTLYPKWNSKAKFYVPRSGAVLRLEVFDFDQATADDHLGYVEIPLECLLNGKKIEPWVRLKLPPEFSKELKKIRQTKGYEENFHLDQVEESYHKTNSWSKARRMGEHACVHLALRFDFTPVGLALTEALWPEDEFIPVVTKFTLERTLTEVFITLRLLAPIIDFFMSDDETGLMDLWNWCKVYRSLSWLVGLFVLIRYQPNLIWSFVQIYFVYLSYRGYRKRILDLVKYRASLAVHKKFGGNEEVKANDLRYYGLEASDFKSRTQSLTFPEKSSPTQPPQTPPRDGKEHLNGMYQQDEGGGGGGGGGGEPSYPPLNGASRVKESVPVLQQNFGRFKSSSFVQPSHAMTSHDRSSSHTHDIDVSSANKSSKKPNKHAPSSPRHGHHSSHSDTVTVAGVPPSPSIHDLSYLMQPNKPLAPLIKDIEYAMWNPKPPAFVGRPPDITHADTLYESAVPVNYDSDYENSNNFAWCPEDDFVDCKFELGGTTRRLLDELINLIRADWMDKVENLLIKIAGILNTLNKLLDWRDPFKSMMIVKVLIVSSILHIFIGFHMFLLFLVCFLFIFFTPYWDYLLRGLLFPIMFPLRLRGIYQLMNDPSHEVTSSSPLMKSGSNHPSSFKRSNSNVLEMSSAHNMIETGSDGDSSPRLPPPSPGARDKAGGGFGRSPNASGPSTHRKSNSGFMSKIFTSGSHRDGNTSPLSNSLDGGEFAVEKVEVKKDNIHPLLKPLLVPHSHLHEIKHRQDKEGHKSKKMIGSLVYNPFAKKDN